MATGDGRATHGFSGTVGNETDVFPRELGESKGRIAEIPYGKEHQKRPRNCAISGAGGQADTNTGGAGERTEHVGGPFGAGCPEELKVFNLQKCGQSALWLIQDNSERINTLEERDKEKEENDRKRDELIKSQQKMLEIMQKEIDKLKTQQTKQFIV